ncbi:hypothetical protein V7795_16535 [Rhizobium laguerreae]|uniref:hypothetical protein n=1 Tax=Rhizobium laguerreae TaxID=1076926 RepID=UPI003000BE40
MPKTSRGRVLSAMIFAVAAALLIPAIAGGVGDPWGKFVSDYQTLITGLAAVGAATWTISVMERTDARQGERHAQLVELSMRGDRLAVQRAVYPQIVGIQSIGAMLGRLKSDILKANTYDGQIGIIVEQSWMAQTACSDLVDLLEREQLKEGSRFFDGILTYKLHWLRETARSALFNVSDTPGMARHHPIEAILAEGNRRFQIDDLYGQILKLADEIPMVVELLAATAKKYGVKG